MIKSAMLVLVVAVSAMVVAPAEARKSKELASNASVERVNWEEFRTFIEKEIRSGDSLSEMTGEDRAEAAKILDRMEQLMGDAENVSDLHNDDRIKLFNEQDKLRILLTEAEADSRMECRKEKVTGSNMPRSICRTVAEWRRYREQSQDFVRRHNMGPGIPREGGAPSLGGGGAN